MDRDRISATLLRLLYLRWTAIDRTRQPAPATIAEIAPCVDAERWLLHDLLADLTAAGLVDQVAAHDGDARGAAYRISSSGRQIVLTDQTTQRRTRFDR
jgi:hypothetical protein